MRTPTETVLDALRDGDCEPKRSDNGWEARCPSHDDRNPSLSVGQNDAGDALVFCQAGCETSGVLKSLGLKQSDLFAKNGVKKPTKHRRRPTPKATKTPGKKATPPAWATLDAALEELTRSKGRPTSIFGYDDAAGEPCGCVVRWDGPGGKSILPIRHDPDGWRLGAMKAPRTLYRLPTLLESPASETVYVTEGEKACDAAVSAGLVATTSAGGSKAANKSDWGPLRGRDVVILPDNDEPGERYAGDVVGLVRAAGARSVRVVRLAEAWPAMPKGGDLADLLDADGPWGGWENADIQGAIEKLVAVAESVGELSKSPTWAPFPVGALPEPMRSLAIEGAKAIGCDPSMIALPALAVCGAAIGGSRGVELKPGWDDSPTIWAGVVARSGSAKSPAMKLALAPLHHAQSIAFGVFDGAMKQHRVDAKRYKVANRGWEQSGGDGFPPIEPDSPVCERLIVSDATLEALAPILQENPRGVLLARDELGAWLKSFGQYKGGLGGDVEAWLSIFDSDRMTIDRKTGRAMTHVEAPHVSICGTIQPGAIERALGDANFENGLAARLLLASPPATCPHFTRESVSETTTTAWATCIENLRALEVGEDDDGKPTPIVVTMTPEAMEVWIALHDELADHIADADDRLSAALSKLRAYAARLALIHSLTTEAGLGAALTTPTPIGVESAMAGCSLARWFANEIERIYDLLDAEDDDEDAGPDAEQRELVKWIEGKGGSVSVRELTHGPRRFRGDTEGAKAALDELAGVGFAHWKYEGKTERLILGSKGGDSGPGSTSPILDPVKATSGAGATGVAVKNNGIASSKGGRL